MRPNVSNVSEGTYVVKGDLLVVQAKRRGSPRPDNPNAFDPWFVSCSWFYFIGVFSPVAFQYNSVDLKTCMPHTHDLRRRRHALEGLDEAHVMRVFDFFRETRQIISNDIPASPRSAERLHVHVVAHMRETLNWLSSARVHRLPVSHFSHNNGSLNLLVLAHAATITRARHLLSRT